MKTLIIILFTALNLSAQSSKPEPKKAPSTEELLREDLLARKKEREANQALLQMNNEMATAKRNADLAFLSKPDSLCTKHELYLKEMLKEIKFADKQ